MLPHLKQSREQLYYNKMNETNKNPGEPNGSQVQSQQGSENKKVRDLSDFDNNEGYWISLYDGDRFLISYYNFDIEEILGMLEKEKVSMTELQEFVLNSPYAFECFGGDAAGFFIDSLELYEGGLYIDMGIDLDTPGKLLVYLKINGEMESPYDAPIEFEIIP